MKNTTAAFLGAILAAAVLTTAAAGFGSNKPAQYNILSTDSPGSLTQQVNKAMGDGWVPLGEAVKGNGNLIMQTMLKY